MNDFGTFSQIGEVIQRADVGEWAPDGGRILDSLKELESARLQLDKLMPVDGHPEDFISHLDQLDQAAARYGEAYGNLLDALCGADDSKGDAGDARFAEVAGKLNLPTDDLQSLRDMRCEFEDTRQQFQALRENQYSDSALHEAGQTIGDLYDQLCSYLKDLVQTFTDKIEGLFPHDAPPVRPETPGLIPVGLGVLDAPSGFHDFATEVKGVEGLRKIPEINPEVWADLGPEQKLVALQNVENTLAAAEGRPPIGVVADIPADDPAQRGCYDHGTTLHINADVLMPGSDVARAVDTIAHEGEHAFQDYAEAHPWVLPDPYLAEVWRANGRHYLDANMYGFELYRNQPVEADAFSWGDKIASDIYGTTGSLA